MRLHPGVSLEAVLEYCDLQTQRAQFKDFPGAYNGLQVQNKGRVHKVGAAVDASLEAFQQAVAQGVDFLIVHHGLFWDPFVPVCGKNYEKIRLLLGHDCALYSSHLPLDAHPVWGNNAALAAVLKLELEGTFLPYEGRPIGMLAYGAGQLRKSLKDRLQDLFVRDGVRALEFGPERLGRIAICSGSGTGALAHLQAAAADTFITGELKQSDFAKVQEAGLNVYLCGHYATEVFGVQNLAQALAAQMELPWVFLPSSCPL